MNDYEALDDLPEGIVSVWGDFNTIGRSNEPEDEHCIFSLERAFVETLEETTKDTLYFVYDHDDDIFVIGFLCRIEYDESILGRWKARPVNEHLYRGREVDLRGWST